MHMLTVREAAGFLHCHPYSLYAAIYEGRIAAIKVGGNVRIKADEVEKALARKEKLERNLSVAEVARILSCSQSSVLRFIHKRKIKAEKIGCRFRISPDALENYVRSLPNV